MKFRLNRFMRKLKNNRPYLSKQQYRTIKGQALSGVIDGAEKKSELTFEEVRI